MRAAGFERPVNSLTYRRETTEAVQEITVSLHRHQDDLSNTVATMLTNYTVVMDAVNQAIEAMTGGDHELGGNFAITLNDWTLRLSNPRVEEPDFRMDIAQPDSVPAAVSILRDSLAAQTIPILDRFKTPADLCKAKLEGDDCVFFLGPADYLRVVAANMLCGRHDEALKVMDRWVGKRTGTRKRYKPVYDYLAARREESQSG